MSMIKNLTAKLLGLWYVKYIVVVILGVLFVGFLDDNSLWAHLRNRHRIEELSAEIERRQNDYQSDQQQIRELQRNPKAVEKLAREQYFMKAQDEDVFVLSEESVQETAMEDSDEAAQ